MAGRTLAVSASLSPSASPTPAQSLREYGRGVLGGLLVSLPLLYTMEMWWAGFVAAPERLLVGLAATFALLLLYNRFAGLRASSSWREIAVDSVEEMGIGLLIAAAVLWMVGEIGPGVPLSEMMGKVAVEAMAVSVGVSVGTAQFGGGSAQGLAAEGGVARSALGTDLALALCGAVLVAANVAPTDEIVQIASEAPLSRLFAIAAASLLLGAATLAIEQADADTPVARRGAGVVRRAVETYAVALLASAGLLWFFGRFDGQDAGSAAALVAVLGFPTALGASAGRLLVEGGDDDDGGGEGGDDEGGDGAPSAASATDSDDAAADHA